MSKKERGRFKGRSSRLLPGEIRLPEIGPGDHPRLHLAANESMGINFRWDDDQRSLVVSSYTDAISEKRALEACAGIGRALISVNGVELIGASREATLNRLTNLSSIPRQLGFGTVLPPPPQGSSAHLTILEESSRVQAPEEEGPATETREDQSPPRPVAKGHADPYSTPARRRRLTYSLATQFTRQVLRQGAARALVSLQERDAVLRIQRITRCCLARHEFQRRQAERKHRAAAVIRVYVLRYLHVKQRYTQIIVDTQSRVRVKLASRLREAMIQVKAVCLLQGIVRKRKRVLEAKRIAAAKRIRFSAAHRLHLLLLRRTHRSQRETAFAFWRFTTQAAKHLVRRIHTFRAALAARQAAKLLRANALLQYNLDATTVSVRRQTRLRRGVWRLWQAAILLQREKKQQVDTAAARAASDAARILLDRLAAEAAITSAEQLLLDRVAADSAVALAIAAAALNAIHYVDIRVAPGLEDKDQEAPAPLYLQDDEERSSLASPIQEEEVRDIDTTYLTVPAAVSLQAWTRSLLQRGRYSVLQRRRLKTAIQFNACCRALKARRMLKRARSAAIVLQCAYRCKRARYLLFVAQVAWEAWACDEVDRAYRRCTDPKFKFPFEKSFDKRFAPKPPPPENPTEEEADLYNFLSQVWEKIDEAEAKDLAQKAGRTAAKKAANSFAQQHKPPATEEVLHYGPEPEPDPYENWEPGKICHTMPSLDKVIPAYVDPPMSQEEKDQIEREFPPDSAAASWFDLIVQMAPPPPNCMPSKLDFLRRLDAVLPELDLDWGEYPLPDIKSVPAELFEGPVGTRFPIPDDIV